MSEKKTRFLPRPIPKSKLNEKVPIRFKTANTLTPKKYWNAKFIEKTNKIAESNRAPERKTALLVKATEERNRNINFKRSALPKHKKPKTKKPKTKKSTPKVAPAPTFAEQLAKANAAFERMKVA